MIYNNDLPNCSEFLSFKIFLDDTKLFASAKDLKLLELQMNLELKKVKIIRTTNEFGTKTGLRDGVA